MNITLRYVFTDASNPLNRTTVIGTAEDAVRLSIQHGCWIEGLDAAGAVLGCAHEGRWMPTGARLGRAPVAGVARTVKVQLGLTPGEHARYTKAASDAGHSLNEWLRRAAAAAMV